MSQAETGLGFEINEFGNIYLKETFVKTKPSFKFSSHLLVSTLIASSFLMVNCNKGGGRDAVKSKTTAGKANDPNKKTATSASGDGTVAQKDEPKNTKQCSADILKAYAPVNSEYNRVKKLHEKNKTAASPEKLKVEFEKVLAVCDTLGESFDKENIKDCALPNKANLPKAPNQCLIIADLLFKEDGTKTPYLKLANDQMAIAKQQQEQNSFENFKKAKLLISEDMKVMLKPENLNFKMYIVDGEIKTNQDEMKKAYQDKKVVCSFSGTSTPVAEKEKVFFSLLEVVENEKSESSDVIINSVGLAMSVSTEKEGQSSGDFVKMGCSHISKDKVDVKLLKKAFGKHLAVDTKESASAKTEPVVATKASGDGTKVKPVVVTKDAKSDFRKTEITEMNLVAKKPAAAVAQSAEVTDAEAMMTQALSH